MLTTLQEKQGGVQAVHQLMAHPSFSVLHADCIPILVGDFHAFLFKCHFLVVTSLLFAQKHTFGGRPSQISQSPMPLRIVSHLPWANAPQDHDTAHSSRREPTNGHLVAEPGNCIKLCAAV